MKFKGVDLQMSCWTNDIGNNHEISLNIEYIK